MSQASGPQTDIQIENQWISLALFCMNFIVQKIDFYFQRKSLQGHRHALIIEVEQEKPIFHYDVQIFQEHMKLSIRSILSVAMPCGIELFKTQQKFYKTLGFDTAQSQPGKCSKCLVSANYEEFIDKSSCSLNCFDI